MGMVRVLPSVPLEQLHPFTFVTFHARHSHTSVTSLNCRLGTKKSWCSDREVPVGGTELEDDATEDNPDSDFDWGQRLFLYSGRRNCVLV